MRKNLPLAITIVSVVLVAVYYFRALDINEYSESLKGARERRLNGIKIDSIDVKVSKLNFFKISKKYKCEATYDPFDVPDTTVLHYDLEEISQVFLVIGEIDFVSHLGDTCSLRVFRSLDDSSSIIVPFGDQTNGETSSVYGRMLALPNDIKAMTFVDFNLSYNPYTEYSAKYNCIAVPTENQLSFLIEAGEKKYR